MYDLEYTLFLSDAFNLPWPTLVDAYEHQNIYPSPDTLLISNGMNRDRILVKKGQRILLRVINSASIADDIWFSVDGHSLQVIEAIGGYIKPQEVERIRVGVGERYSVILKADGSVANYQIRADYGEVKGYEVLYYEEDNSSSKRSGGKIVQKRDENTINAHPGISHAHGIHQKASADVCVDKKSLRDFDIFKAQSYYTTGSWPSPAYAPGQLIRLQLLENSPKFFINGVNFKLPSVPFISQVYTNRTEQDYDLDFNSIKVSKGKNAIIILENQVPYPHPFHLHGHNMLLLGRGAMPYTEGAEIVPRQNPIIIDSILLDGNSWVALQLLQNNPGVWLVHCVRDQQTLPPCFSPLTLFRCVCVYVCVSTMNFTWS